MSRTLRRTWLSRIEQVFVSRTCNAVVCPQEERPVSMLFGEAWLVSCIVGESFEGYLCGLRRRRAIAYLQSKRRPHSPTDRCRDGCSRGQRPS